MHKTILLLLIAILLSFVIFNSTATGRLTDKDAVAGLGEFIKSLEQLDKAVYGEVAVVYPLEPVILVSSQKKRYTEEIGGYGSQVRTANGSYLFGTPFDKCNWFINLISFPLEQKIVTAPGITTVQDMYAFRLHNSYWYPMESYTGGLSFYRTNVLIDDLAKWQADTTAKVVYFNVDAFKTMDALLLHMAVEIPGGDAWLDDMRRSFKRRDIFTFHLKAFTRNNPDKIILGDVKVPYSQIYPFLSELVIGLESVQGLRPMTDRQKQWVRREPVRNIAAFGEFIVSLAKSPTDQSCFGPPARLTRYMDRIYTNLNSKDPGNTPSMVHNAVKRDIFGHGRSRGWKSIIAKKPYLALPYRRFVEAEGERRNRGTYDGTPVFKKAVVMRPDVAWLHMAYVGCLLRNSDFDSAVEQYRICERLEPGIHINHIYWEPWNKDRTLTLRFAEMVQADYPDDLGNGRFLAGLYAEEGQNAKAIELYKKCATLYPDYVSTWTDLAKLYRKLGNGAGEKEALEGFLDNVDYSKEGYQDDINTAKARLAELKGDTRAQIASLLMEFPFHFSGDSKYLDLAEALEKERHIADALYLAYVVIADLDSRRKRFHGDEGERYKRAVAMRDRLVKIFWPGFDPSTASVHSGSRKPEDLAEFRRLLDENPGLVEVREYADKVRRISKDDPAAILSARLMEVIVSEAVDETGSGYGFTARSQLEDWGEYGYNEYMRRKFLEIYGEQ